MVSLILNIFIMKSEIHGFTLMELLITLSIIAILLGIAIPNYIHIRAKVLQSEPPVSFATLLSLELVYKGQYQTFTSDLQALGFNLDGRAYYTYTVLEATRDQFLIQASGNLDLDSTLDIWTLNHEGKIRHIRNDIAE